MASRIVCTEIFDSSDEDECCNL